MESLCGYWQGACAILRQSVILPVLGFSTFLSFIFLLNDGNVKPLHLMRNKSRHIFGPHLWLGRFQRGITYTDPSLSIVTLQSEYHLQL